jgi:GMP synthase-like glutamine amidotransferase
MSTLILKNTPAEGPGTIGEFLDGNALPYRVVELSKGEEPPALDGFGALVVMGGPMAVYEMDEHPYLKKEAGLIREAVDEGKKVLGVCLGAQMVAHALGADVYGGSRGQEVGWHDVELTPEGEADPVMGSLVAGDGRPVVKVFHWHGDTFDLPEGAIRLAGSALYENQAFRHGDNVYALQFHIEATEDMIREWFSNKPGDHSKVLADTEIYAAGCTARAMEFYSRFFLRN